MQTLWVPRKMRYDGSQMAPQWAYLKFDLVGDSVVGFEGPCEVRRGKVLDLEEVRHRSPIRGPHMLHWVIEHFDGDLRLVVARQRLLAAIVMELLVARTGRRLRREGDDLYDGERKLSISVAAPTPVSCKIHFAVNVRRARGVGVPTEGIATYNIRPRALGEAVIRLYARELQEAEEARCKARCAR